MLAAFVGLGARYRLRSTTVFPAVLLMVGPVTCKAENGVEVPIPT